MPVIVWFRDDLRLKDNQALSAACHSSADGVVGVYIIDPELWLQHDVSACRVDFILRGLEPLRQQLAQINIPLCVFTVKHTQDIGRLLRQLAQKMGAKSLFFNRQYEVNESRRDAAIQADLQLDQIHCYSYDDSLILPPGSVLTKQGGHFQVFTAFKNAWLSVLAARGSISILPVPPPQPKMAFSLDFHDIPKQIPGLVCELPSDIWPAGESEAALRLKRFIEHDIARYHEQRDFPAYAGTSQLSPYLACGMISPRVCWQAAAECVAHSPGAATWMNELIWREFYKHLLVAVPRISMNKAYLLATEKIPWRYDAAQFVAWQTGQTGIPIVDAGMRQLNSIGWMHNRLRMIVAMFLSKNLLMDWRLGERYFMQQLIDGDLAANNGGWQWSASTGTDAAPYFRIFNPILQSEKFDPEGRFIRQYCPELGEFDHWAIHDPHHRAPELAKRVGYPEPIVDLAHSRHRAIEVFKAILKK